MRRLPLLTLAAARSPSPAPAQRRLRPPMVLPGDAGAASTADWIVGARPGAAADAIAARHGARRDRHRLLRRPARPRARALRARCGHGLLLYAEPEPRSRRRMQVPAPDPLDARAAWRAAIVDPSLVPPPVTDASPLLALVDATADVNHPEFQGGHLSDPRRLPALQRARDGDRRGGRRAQERPRHPRRLAGHARASTSRCRTRSLRELGDRHRARDPAGRLGDQHELRRHRRRASPSTSSCRSPPPRASRSSPPRATSWPRATRCSSPPRCRT